jgi:non-ribosomal peptide synthase protein (TIGR01720 family)
MLAGPDPLLADRPLDPARDTVAAGTRTAELTLSTEATAALLTRVPAAFHAGIDDVLLAGLVTALAAWRGDLAGGVLVDVEGHGRVGGDLGRTVGWFTEAHPVRLDPSGADPAEVRTGGPAAGRLIKQIKEQLRAVPGDGLGHGLLRYADGAPELARLPRAQIGFNYLGRFAASKDQAGPWQPAEETAVGGAPDPRMAESHVLRAGGVVQDRPGGPELTVTLTAPAGLLGMSTLDELTGGWVAVLNGLVAHGADPGSGGHTPSDFSLVTLDQNEIDEFEFKLADDRSAQ